MNILVPAMSIFFNSPSLESRFLWQHHVLAMILRQSKIPPFVLARSYPSLHSSDGVLLCLCTLLLHFIMILIHMDFLFELLGKKILLTLHLCLAVSTLWSGRIPFSYLEDIQMRFMKNYGRVAAYAPAYAMNDEFSRVLHQQMEFFSSNPSADTMNRVRGEVNEASINFWISIRKKYIQFKWS